MTPTPPAGRRVRVGILGTGGMGGAHAQRFRDHPDVQITALGDVSVEHMERFIATHLPDCTPRPAIFTDASAMMNSGLIDAVAIITPHTLHFDHAMLAADAGLHVLMEKPMVTAAAQAHALATRFESTGKVFVIGYNTPCTPAFAWLREAIRTRRFGRLELISGYLSQNWKHLTTGSWRQLPALSGGGQAYDSGAHLLNSLCWSVESDVDEVYAFLDHQGTPVDINSTVNLRFKNGVMACVAIGGNCPVDGADLHYLFERGRVDIDGWMGQWVRAYDAGGEIKDLGLTGRAQTPNDNFIDAILGRAEPRTSLENGIVQSELMDAIYASAQSGRPARPARA